MKIKKKKNGNKSMVHFKKSKEFGTMNPLNTKINPKYFLRTSLDEKVERGYGFLSGSKRFKRSTIEKNPGPGKYQIEGGNIGKKIKDFNDKRDVFSIGNIYMRRKSKSLGNFGRPFITKIDPKGNFFSSGYFPRSKEARRNKDRRNKSCNFFITRNDGNFTHVEMKKKDLIGKWIKKANRTSLA